jgi:heterodisulfide reductase subunit A
MGQDKPKGSVVIIGGGISGIQAALSLAGAGYGVHLLERMPSLGGMIPNLHRIYPLCSCCKLDPRISACEQDPNINIMLNTSVLDISGTTGNFSISLKTGDETKSLKCGAVVLAAGIEAFDPAVFDTYAYGNFPNVITSVEYEQRQKPLGPEQGVIKRPSDGKTPEKIAWLQCVGSRNINKYDAPYCSSVCCMYALKEAVNTKDLDENIDTTIFYMDMRTHGKGFEDYLNAAIERDVNLIRSRVHTVDPVPGSDDLLIAYADENEQMHKEKFDMVVLSVGLKPSGEAVDLAKKIGVKLNENQFISNESFMPVSTNMNGIFVCGGLNGPFDICESITQAAAVVSEIASILEPEPFAQPMAYPRPKKAGIKDPRILVAYHLCPGMSPELGTDLENHAREIPGVTAITRVEDDILTPITEKIKETNTNRLVFASCTPTANKNILEEALRLAGLNPYLSETVDLRAMDSQTATVQLKDRLRMAVARAALITPPPVKEIPVVKRALVVGGGVAGLESALSISREGYPVTLIEKEKVLGGHARHVRATWQGNDVQKYLKDLISSVRNDKNIKVMTETTVKHNKGFAGRFVTTVEKKGKERDILHGITVLATGANPVTPEEYQYGRNKNVYLWSELSEKMIKKPAAIQAADSAVFIQCVGSREPACPHCSNFCCSFAVRTAVDLKNKKPDMKIFVLYREMRTYGERENLYSEARDKGIIFIRYDLDNKPEVKMKNDRSRLSVTVYDPILERPVALKADFVSLQTAIVGNNNRELADIFRVNLDNDGFLSESPEKLKPVHASTKGIYMAGLAVYPKDTTDSITQAKAASASALEILSKDTVRVGGQVAEVMPEKCALCCTCVRTCPFNVPFIDHEVGAAFIDPGLCQGCGMCVAECPGKAIVMSTCSDQMLTEAPSVLLNVEN